MSDALTALLQYSDQDYSWLAQFFSLWVLPFAHEDLAIILGGYIVVNKIMPVGLVAAAIYGGMVASDFALYGIGAGARRLPWLTRFAVGDRIGAFAEILKRNLFGLVALCRVVPGVVFVAFVACGWARVPLGRFTIASLAVSALYLPLMLYLVIVSGDALDDRVGVWAWPLLLVMTTALGFIRWRVFTFQNAARERAAAQQSVSQVAPRAAQARRLAPGDGLPSGLFRLRLVASWIRLAWQHGSLTLPSVVNPRPPGRGLWGESRSESLLAIAAPERRWVADFVVIRRSAEPRSLYCDLEHVRRVLEDARLTFPLVAKPDRNWSGYGITRIAHATALRDYLREFPGGATLMLQRCVPRPGDAAVLYARLPGSERGRILSLAFRHDPYVIGDGDATLRELIEKTPCARSALSPGTSQAHKELARVPANGEVVQLAPLANARPGRNWRDASRHITPALEARFDAIASSMDEFHYGRFDLRFASIAQLMRGEEFSIVGVHGVGAELFDAEDTSLPLGEVYRRLTERQRILFLIGAKNRARGFAPMRCADVLAQLWRRSRRARRGPASA